MRKEILRKLGLTEGEIKVYEALVKLGKSSTGPVMKKSGISSSKIYLILEKLMQKGIVSFIVENNVKKFYPTNPQNLVDYIEKQQKDLDETKKEIREFASELTKIMGKYEEESAQIYKGLAGMRAVFQNLLDELKKGDEFLFFAIPEPKIQKKGILFFQNLQLKRAEKGIITKGIVDVRWEKQYRNIFKGMKKIKLKALKLSFPHALAIGKNRVIISLWEENPIAFEIISKRFAQRYRDFFHELWKN